jgi:hypothetical protein
MDRPGLYINKYLPPAILYFFFNGVFLPLGILYTGLLTPVFLIWLARYRTIRYLPLFFLFTVPLFFIHLANGIEVYSYYLNSYLLSFTVYVFGLAFYQYLENCHTLRYVFKWILLINFAMVIVSLICLFIPPLTKTFWYNDNMSLGRLHILRMQMLTYEPSYYSTLFAPIAIYFLLKLIRRELPNPWLYYCLVLIPLFLSLSFGVILGIGISLLVLLLIHSKDTIFKKKNLKYFFGGAALVGGILGFLFLFYPDNVFFRRIENVLSGNDSSFRGRTSDSFTLCMAIIKKKSFLFGVGFGQVKILGLDIFRKFYKYSLFTVQNIAIPNAIGDLFVTLGLVTLILKLFLEIYFFFKTRVISNHYRLALFLFIFIYQFTGSFMTNIAEYVIWIMAFKTDLFPEFIKTNSTNRENPVHYEGYAVQK